MNQYSYRYEKKIRNRELLQDLLCLLPEFVNNFVNDKMAAEKFQSSTALEYARNIYAFLDYLVGEDSYFGNIPVEKITLDMMDSVTYRQVNDFLVHIERYYVEGEKQARTNGTASKARKLSAIRSLYNYLLTHHLVKNNPCFGVDTPTVKEKPIIYLEREEKSMFLQSVSDGTGLTKGQESHNGEHQRMRDYVITTLLLCTGLRASELVGINIEDINDTTESILVVRKGNKVQNIYLAPEMLEMLHDYIDNYRPLFYPTDDERALFLNRDGDRLGVRGLEYLVKKYANASLGMGNKITPHKLRSTYGTEIYEKTDDIYLTADALGHSNIQVTARHYANMSEKHRKNAVISPSSI